MTRALLPGLVASAVGYGPTGERQSIHRGLPSPYLTFIFSLAGPVVTGHTIAHASGHEARRTDIVLGGLTHQPSYVRPDPDQRGVQLAVHPLAARALFGLPARELAEVMDGADVLGADAERLRQRLAEETNWPSRFRLVQAFLRERVERRPAERVRPEVAEAWRWLGWHRGGGSMSGLARHVELSGRQLGTLFARELGASPKQVGRLMRFDHAKQRISRAVYEGRPLDLTGIALDCGYYDHAHLDRDFAQFRRSLPLGEPERTHEPSVSQPAVIRHSGPRHPTTGEGSPFCQGLAFSR